MFIHIPKTGGNSIQNIISQYSDDEVVCLSPHQDGVERFEVRSQKYNTHKHSTYEEYRREYGSEMCDGLFKFCCVRNPWERVVSHYFSPHRGQVVWSREAFLQFINSPEVKPLAHYLAVDGDELQAAVAKMSCVVRYENIQADFDQVCNLLRLPRTSLPHRNKSNREDYSKYYDSESAAVVMEKLKAEIELFGYTYS
ncbi:sulfotransferase family 2 domain-containing protein [Pseudomonas sp. UL070]|uniref:Sulfotransferase family 2 domain-containing protein n=1 Tax=Aquipseudomonas ullengensis TaxID=2759166 RepID=A0A7W4QBE9_9GAMM|nr:sulfotransferase family 2 domain-containing protein [Pseudomonas ullengensis]